MTFEKLPEPSVPPRRPRGRRLPALAWLATLAAVLAVGWRWSAPPKIETPRRTATSPSLADEDLEGRIVAAWQEGRRLKTDGQGEAAAAEFARALAIQRRLNVRFPASRFVSLGRLAEFEADRQMALALAPLARLGELEQQLDGHLRRRELHQARMILAECVRSLGALRGKFPQARGVADGLAVKIAFLQSRAGELETIQDRCYDRLVPLPGRAPPALMRSAVTQEDFQRVMGLNPSAERAASRGVDSLTHAEAEEYCRRLAWVLGFPARLPGAGELRSALAASRAAFDDGEEWLRAESPGHALAPIFSSDGSESRLAARGSGSPARGFRVVVETDLARPPG
ncbi:MAG: hypothetical protein C0502_02775 [Opitutus sp.]|nr:hypothetical protein [Opitutus sp.]